MCKVKKPKEFSGFCMNSEIMTWRLTGKKAAWRVHGGGFAGTIQAFVPTTEVEGFRALMDSVFGEGKCIVLRIRPEGAVKIF